MSAIDQLMEAVRQHGADLLVDGDRLILEYDRRTPFPDELRHALKAHRAELLERLTTSPPHDGCLDVAALSDWLVREGCSLALRDGERLEWTGQPSPELQAHVDRYLLAVVKLLTTPRPLRTIH